MDVALEGDVVEESRISKLEADVREMRKDIASLKGDGADSRGELQARDAALRLETGFGALQRQMQRTSLGNRICMLTAAAAILAVMAHGFKWI